MKRLHKEPLLHFLLFGAGLFLFFSWGNGSAPISGISAGSESARIVVFQNDISQLADAFERTWQRPPTEEELNGLVDGFVRDEIYFREATAIGLDRGDNVIRRRLRLKMEYIFEDIAAQGEPTGSEIEEFYRKNSERYLVEPQVSFQQVFVNIDKRGEDGENYAHDLLLDLNRGADPDTVGDPFLLGPEAGLMSLWEVRKLYGESFAQSLLDLSPGRWQGPINSTYGLHLVFITKSEAERIPMLSEVLDSIKRDWKIERQEKLKDEAYARLKERYTVEIEKTKELETVKVDKETGGPAVR